MLMKKKIVHIITRLDKGGSSENVLATCEYFYFKKLPVKRNYEIVLIYGGEKKFEFGFKSYYIKELQRNIFPFKDFVAFIKIFNIIKKEKPDIVHTHTSKAGILGRWAAYFLNLKLKIKNEKLIKIVHTPHGHIFYGYYGKIITAIFIFIEKITAKITNRLIALTDGEKNESLAFDVGEPKQWVVIPSGIGLSSELIVHSLELEINSKKLPTSNSGLWTPDFELRTQLGIPQDATVVGTVARLESVKGIKYLIDAIKIIISSPNPYLLTPTYFLIVGDGSERKMLEKMVEEYGLKDKVIFTGMREDVLELISIMDIYVQPSLNEGMGKTIVIASMLGKPIVATKVQGIPSVIIDGETGVLVEPKNALQLSKAILMLINDKNLREKIGESAKKWVSKIVDGYPQFSVERMMILLEKLYNSI